MERKKLGEFGIKPPPPVHYPGSPSREELQTPHPKLPERKWEAKGR